MVRGKDYGPSIDVKYFPGASSPRLTHASLFRAGWYWPNTAEFFPGNSAQLGKGLHYNAFTFNQRPVTVVPLHAHPQALIMIETHPDFKFAAEKNIEKDREDITSC